MAENKTISYYNSNAKRFAEETLFADFEFIQKIFTDKLPDKAVLLDFGCGSGRDTRYFMKQGFQVDAIDGSVNLCKLASRYTGIEVKNILFHELAETGKYDGIWACSSILHLPVNELANVMEKMIIALRDNGIIYTSFKYGTFAGYRNGRYFTDMTENTFAGFIGQINNVITEEQWVSPDVRQGREEEKWLNIILRKK